MLQTFYKMYNYQTFNLYLTIFNNLYIFRYTNAQLTEEKEVVVLGSSFIAMEAANYCLNKVKKVTVIFRGDLPFQALLGPRIGAAFLNLFKEKGVNFVYRSGIVKVNADSEGKVESVELKDGKFFLKANICR